MLLPLESTELILVRIIIRKTYEDSVFITEVCVRSDLNTYFKVQIPILYCALFRCIVH